MSGSGLERRRLRSFDDVELSYLEGGEGRTVVLVHGFIASAERNWAVPGIAGRLLDAGFRVVAPDLRGHGASAHPADPAAWPPDVLARDLACMIAATARDDYDLVGYSLGARTVVRALAAGLRPRRAVLGGMGAEGVMRAGARAKMFRDAILAAPGAADPAARTIQAMMAAQGLAAAPLLGVLDSFVSTSEAELRAIATPTLVVCGDRDRDNGSGQALADLLGDAVFREVPGDHLTAVVSPQLPQAILDFLG